MSIFWQVAYPGMVIVATADKEGYHREGHPAAGTIGVCVRPGRYRNYVARYNSYSNKVPGIYENDGNWMVLWAGATEEVNVDTYNCEVAPESKEHYDLRKQGLWADPIHKNKTITMHIQEDHLRRTIRIGDLPETKFWEGDIVRPVNGGHVYHGDNIAERRIYNIDYRWAEDTNTHHQGEGSYDIDWVYPNGEYAGCGSSHAWDSDMELVRRGNVWKYFNNEPLSFRDIREEVGFMHGIRQVVEVRNPENNLYSWDKDSALKAIQDGIADHFKLMNGLFGAGSRESVYKCLDLDLGARVRKATLEGFGLSA